ncbi:MAG: hypothetical protein MUF38_05180 [Anaerolineae bacterium]|nr:hypothetical protein [Anaerolineae bacterium]
MGKNIDTFQLRLFHRSHHLVQDIGRWLNILFFDAGRSHFVPVVLKQNPTLGYTDIQYGRKYGVSIDEMMNQYNRFFSAAWVRYTNDLTYMDAIFSYTDMGESKAVVCYYGFDHLTVRWHEGFNPPDLGFPTQTHSRVWSIPLKGRYSACNNRDYFNHHKPYITTPTTPASEMGEDRGEVWKDYFHDVPSLAQFDDYKPNIEALEFRWNGRLVRVMQPKLSRFSEKREFEWSQWYLDHWDNCVDEAWLAFNGLTF